MIRLPLLAPLLSSSLLLAACGENGTTLGRFTVNEDLDETTVRGSNLATLLPGDIDAFQLDVSASEDFPSEDDFDFLTKVVVNSITLSISAGSEDPARDATEDGMPDDFAFIESLSLSIEAVIDGTTQSVAIASVEAGDARLAEGSRSFSLDMTGANILPFVEAESGYRLVSDANGTPPPDDVIFDGKVRYKVSVGFR